jgi:formylglycine-generating enzyme required for sulfatase activity
MKMRHVSFIARLRCGSFGCRLLENDTMASRLLFLICFALPVAVAGPRASAQRGLSINPSPGAIVSPDPGAVFRDCDDCPELVVVPPGDFIMGSNDTPYEKPARSIAIRRPFAIGRREVTFAEWDICVDAGACKHRPDDHGWGRGDRPAINVSWDDAKLYIAWLSQKVGQRYRLPTEAEWEYAARAGTESPFWWSREVGAGRAQCDGCGSPANRQSSTAVSFRPNGFGLFDTAGNAAEWVEGCWNDNYRDAPKDAAAWTSGDCHLRVLRGGAFTSKPTDRSSARFRYDSDVRYYANGFRIVRDL